MRKVPTPGWIRAEEPQDNGRRKRDDDENKKEKPQWQDDTIVSIAALKQFLSTLIAPDSQYQKSSPSSAPETSHLSPQQQRSHNAANAYQSTARHVPSAPVASVAEQPPDLPTLTQEENRTIHELMNDLDLLLQNGMTSLTIQKEGSFLESLSRAAKAALQIVT